MPITTDRDETIDPKPAARPMTATLHRRFAAALLFCLLLLFTVPHNLRAVDDPPIPPPVDPGGQPQPAEMLPPTEMETRPDRTILPEDIPAADMRPPGSTSPPSSRPPARIDTAARVAVTNGQRLVSIDFNSVDIVVFIKFISDLTKKNFVIDERVKAKVSIVSPGKITVDEAYKVFESVLDVHGFSAIPSGEITKIVPAPEARTKNIKTRLQEESGASDDSVVTQIVPMRYADTEEIKRLFTPLVSKNAVILSYAPTNTLIITDVQSNINRLLRILKAIDVTGVGQQIALIKVQYADATKLVTLLTSVFKPPQRAGKPTPEQKEITFVADERTNTLVVLASEGDTENIRQLVRNLDQEMPKGQGRIHVYYLEHATAEELAKVLQDIPQQKAGGAPEGKPVTQSVSDKVKITADKATNSLIINADNQDYATIEDIIRKVDIPRAMVYIEALIMEVNVNKDFRLGTEWILGGKTARNEHELIYGGGFSGGTVGGGDPGYSQVGTATIGTGAATTAVKVLPPGMALGIFGEALEISGVKFPSIGAVIDAYKKDTDARILSTPQILTTDNQEAKIYVGRNVPFQTSAAQGTAGTSSLSSVYNSFEYRDVGKTLKITPQISKDLQVRLALSLEVTALESNVDNRPITLKRTIETTAIVRDKQTIVLGGLIDDNTSTTDYRVPCLGDIPGIGMLFRSMATGGTKANLYIFLTPRVIPRPEDGKEISSKKREEIDQLRSGDIKLYNKRPEPPVEQPEPIPAPPTSRRESETTTSVVSDSATSSAAEEKPVVVETASSSSGEETATPTNGTRAVNVTPSVAVQKASASPPPPLSTGGTGLKSAAGQPNERVAGGYTIQVISLQTAEAADQMLKELTAMGYAAYTVRSESSGKTWFRMRVGYYNSQKAAEEVMTQLRANRYHPILIKL